eukprot:4861632-Alexandrium_andersonii.AAC.1
MDCLLQRFGAPSWAAHLRAVLAACRGDERKDSTHRGRAAVYVLWTRSTRAWYVGKANLLRGEAARARVYSGLVA